MHYDRTGLREHSQKYSQTWDFGCHKAMKSGNKIDHPIPDRFVLHRAVECDRLCSKSLFPSLQYRESWYKTVCNSELLCGSHSNNYFEPTIQVCQRLEMSGLG